VRCIGHSEGALPKTAWLRDKAGLITYSAIVARPNGQNRKDPYRHFCDPAAGGCGQRHRQFLKVLRCTREFRADVAALDIQPAAQDRKIGEALVYAANKKGVSVESVILESVLARLLRVGLSAEDFVPPRVDSPLQR
jgi:hypothetical protein